MRRCSAFRQVSLSAALCIFLVSFSNLTLADEGDVSHEHDVEEHDVHEHDVHEHDVHEHDVEEHDVHKHDEGAHEEAHQEEEDHDHDHGEEHGAEGTEHSHNHRFALGLSVGPVYLVNEKEFTAGFHTHFIVALGRSGFGLGVGYEHLFDDHSHNGLGAVIQYRILDPWTVGIAAGIAFEGSDFSTVEPALHIETTYEVEVGPVDMGPAIEVAIEPEGVHLALTLHVGIHF